MKKKKRELAAKIEKFKEQLSSVELVPRRQESLDKRRQYVWQMAIEGVPVGIMAEILNVSRFTINDDMNAIYEQQTKFAKKLKDVPDAAATDIGVTVKKLDNIAEAAMSEYSMATTAQDKDRFLNTASKALVNRTRILVETGFLPKAGIEVTSTVEHSVSFEQRFGSDSKFKILDDASARRRIMAVAEAALKFGLKSATEDIKPLEVTAKVIEEPKIL